MNDPVKIRPSEAQPAGHGATPELPQPKTPTEWAEARGQGRDFATASEPQQ